MIYDIADRESFNQAKELYNSLIKPTEGTFLSTYLVGNKLDLVQKDAGKRQVSKEEGEEYARSIDFDFIELSVKADADNNV